MTDPLNSKDLAHIQRLDYEFQDFIAQIEKGNAPNPTKLLHIETELKGLVKNKNIPDSVNHALQSALLKLTSEDSIDIYGAKIQVDKALEEGQ